MGAINTTKWSTSFFYEQDLRSSYMNNLLSSIIKPGIYNANMFLSTEDGEEGRLILRIRKGTTFVFSNCYNNKTGEYERDLLDVRSYIVKSTALEDVTIGLAEFNPNESPSVAVEKILGISTEKSAAETFHIAAIMKYDPEKKSEEYTYPNFKCIIKNPLREESSPDEKEKQYFYLPCEASQGTTVYSIPDGLVSMSEADYTYSYLILGKVVDTAYQEGLYYVKNTNPGQIWNDRDGGRSWIKNHLFIGRGFPDYRQSYISDRNIYSPDFYFSKEEKGDRIYIDATPLTSQDLLFQNEVDWRDVEKIGAHHADLSNKLQYFFGSTQIEEGGESHNILEEEMEEWEGAGVVNDIIFLATRSRYSNWDGTAIENIFSSIDSTDEFVKGLKVLHFRWISNCIFNNLDPKLSSEGATPNSIPDGYVSETGTNFPAGIVPLDLSSANRDRLLNLIRNRNVIPAVINYLRQNPEVLDSDADGKMSPVDETSLIPVFIAFRKFDSSKKFVDDASTYTRINPANIFSFLDSQYKTSRVNNISINAQDIYSILPIME